MRTIEARNVEEALVNGLWVIKSYGVRADSRNGPVLVAPWPVVTVTTRPTERVLLAPWRDANPFFHLVESAWMLAGRDDAKFLTPYVKRLAQYAEDGGIIHGAYGMRWRYSFGIDQLNVVVRRLKVDHGDRQCVIQMWDCDPAGLPERNDLMGQWKDRPCNTHVYLRVREQSLAGAPSSANAATLVLDLTVCCRSNDMLWGAHGANAVHFSFLQEYLADRIGVGVGVMYQLSNNYHAYVNELDKVVARRREANSGDYISRYVVGNGGHARVPAPLPMRLQGEPAIDPDLDNLCPLLQHVHEGDPVPPSALGTSFARTVLLAAQAHAQYRAGRTNIALAMASAMEPMDWRAACVEWLQRRATSAAHSPAREGASLP